MSQWAMVLRGFLQTNQRTTDTNTFGGTHAGVKAWRDRRCLHKSGISNEINKVICRGLLDELHKPICWDYSPFFFSRTAAGDQHFVVELKIGRHYVLRSRDDHRIIRDGGGHGVYLNLRSELMLVDA